MHFDIRHTTVYRYDRPVSLGRHVFRLHPRQDGFLNVHSFELSLYPPPAEITKAADVEGNLTHTLGFLGVTQEFRISFRSTGETLQRPPFVLESQSVPIPPPYQEGTPRLEAYLRLDSAGPSVSDLARETAGEAKFGVLDFLERLNVRIYERLLNVPRMIGEPLDPETTLRQGRGSCRDLAMLFIACCRHQGVAARFVSGYFPADPGMSQHMHAWAEAYLPGAGWLAYDPTQGREAGPSHVPSAAAADPRNATPIMGFFTSPGARSEMSVELTVEMT